MFKNITNNAIIGRLVNFLPSCHSTNDVGLALIKTGDAQDGTIIITTNQTQGRGQRGNKWVAEPGKNLTFSIILDVSFLKYEGIFGLNMAVSLGIVSFFNSTLNTQHSKLKIKWPNDLYYDDKKLGGILIENIYRSDGSVWAVVGIGININQVNFSYLNATSLAAICKQFFDLEELLLKLTQEIEYYFEMLREGDLHKIKPLYLQNLYHYMKFTTYRSGEEIFEGKIIDVNDIGQLVVENKAGLRVFDKQEIRFLI